MPSERDGRNWPSKQPGHVGQLLPDPVTRTMTPIVTSRIVVATVAAASLWKRVTVLLGDAGIGLPCPRASGTRGTSAILARVVGRTSVGRPDASAAASAVSGLEGSGERPAVPCAA